MWNRRTLKDRAKSALRGRYGSGVLILFLYGLITWLFSALISQISVFTAAPTLYQKLSQYFSVNITTMTEAELRVLTDDILAAFAEMGQTALIFAGVIGLVVLLFNLLFRNTLIVGRTRWFVRNSESEYEIPASHLFGLFRGGQFGPTVRSMLWRDIWQLIWALPALAATGWLAFVHVVYLQDIYNTPRTVMPSVLDLVFQVDIPYTDYLLEFSYLHIVGIASIITLLFGIVSFVKYYSYRMVPYILADNPRYGALKTLRLSKRMTKGQKGGIFFLDLSFVGWYLLTMFCCLGLPLVFWLAVGPYYFATNAELYGALRLQAVQDGRVSMEELGFVKAVPFSDV